MRPEHLHTHISPFPESELRLLNECSQIHINNTNIDSLINLRNVLGIDNKCTRYQIHYLQDKNNVPSGLTFSPSSVEMLIKALSSRNDSNNLYVTFEPTEGLPLITGKVLLINYLKPKSLMKVPEGNNSLINQFKLEFRVLRNKYTRKV